MPIINQQKTDLSYHQRIKLKALLHEAESRGLPIAEKIREKLVQKSRIWETDSNGYFVRRDGRLFLPYESQANFVISRARYALFVGSRGSGKTAGGAQKSLAKARQGFSGAVLNPTFEKFKDSTWPEFRDWIPWKYVVPSHKYRADISWEPQRPFHITFENGANVICKGLKDPSSARGPNINWLWFDEAQDDEDGMAWKIAVASVRIGKNPQAWATATGRGTLHWLYELFVEQEFEQDVLDELEKIQRELDDDVSLIEWFNGTIYDNKDNLDPMFFASMLATYPVGYLRDQELYGKFADPGGNLGDAKWFEGRILPNAPSDVKNRVRYWDLAATEKKIAGKKITDPDETCGTLLSHFIDENLPDSYQDQFCIEDQVAGTWKWDRIKTEIRDTAMKDGPFIPIYCEQEPGSGGINQLAALFEYLKSELPGWTFREHKPQGDKVVRANIWFAEACETKEHPVKQFWMLLGDWNTKFLKQLSSFPNAKHDDRVDSTSGARVCCAPIAKWRRIKFMHLGQSFDETGKKPEGILTL